MKNENKVEQKKKKAAYDKEYRARKKFLDEIEKTEEFVVSCREKYSLKLKADSVLLFRKMTNIAT